MKYWQRLLLNTLIFLAIAQLFPNLIYISGILTAIMASFVLSVLNALVKPVLHLLSLPITILTLGLFSLVINGFILQMTSFIVGSRNFSLNGFGAAFLVALILSLVNSLVTTKDAEQYDD